MEKTLIVVKRKMNWYISLFVLVRRVKQSCTCIHNLWPLEFL